MKFFPNAINNAQLILERTINCEGSTWQLRYISLLWSSLMMLTPFPLAKVFPSKIDQQLIHETGQAKLLSQAVNKETQATAYLLAIYYMRPDTQDKVGEFLNWMEQVS